MKHAFLLLSAAFLLILSYGCKKKVFDARKKYVGTWEMTVISNSTTFTTDMGGNSVVTESTDTSVKDVEIAIDESNENGLILLFPNQQPKKVSLTNKSKFEKACESSGPVISGEFQSKKGVSMTMSNHGHSCNSYSAGGYSNQTVTGIKK